MFMPEALVEIPEMPEPEEEKGRGHHDPGGLIRWIAIFTAVISTLAALIGHQAEEIANDAILLKNEAGLKKTEASDQWNYYQAVSTKSHLMELAMTLAPEAQRAPFADKIKKYETQKDDIKAEADKLEADSAKANKESLSLSVPRGNYMYALALLQVGISVVSVTVLTRQRWLFGIALAFGVIGVGIAGYTFAFAG
jgi:Domain of unknown function (DUF4337)